MVKLKNKSHYSLNPADRERKKQRRKEIERNRRERKFNRDASSKKDNPEDLKAELEELLGKEEESGKLNQVDRLRKKVLQDQLKIAIKEQHHARTGTDTSKGFDPVLFSRAQTGAAEPSAAAVDAAVAAPSPEAAAPSADAELLPPPGRPFGLLPPPATAPPAAAAIAYGRPAMPPPMRPPPVAPPPPGGPPARPAMPPPAAPPAQPAGEPKKVSAVIGASSTVVKAHEDKALLAFVPAHIQAQRAGVKRAPPPKAPRRPIAAAGTPVPNAVDPMLPAVDTAPGAAPAGPSAARASSAGAGKGKDDYAKFLSELGELGAFE